MSGKKEHRVEGTKRSDKMIDPHREFLDMDTDEEDFGRQESPEIEEELPPEPEKPVFSDAELTTLVKYVKDLTIFPSCGNKHWNENCSGIIREYFENPSHEVLSIFHKENKLTATLNVPDCAPKGFVYFLRSPWQIYTKENFFSTVLFGSITDSVPRSVLKFMENIYAPSVLRSDGYTSFIKNQVFSNLHEFIIHLSEEVYKPINLTTLYVPKESQLDTFLEPPNRIDCYLLGENPKTFVSEETEEKRNLIGRLDKVAWSWIRQMDEATRVPTAGKRIQNIQGEVDYWNAKHSNLNYLRAQLLNPEVRLVIDILRSLRSSSVDKFEVLTQRIATRLKESSSNLTHLYILFDCFKSLNVPEDTENSVTEALLLILFIWTESPFYNDTNSIGVLCQALSLQIISQCNEYIQLDVALGSNPEEGMKMLKKCILCCDIYKVIYNNVIRNVIPRVSPDKKWNLSEEDVFNTIDTFKQRCYDVIEICAALVIFGRHNKIGLLGSPKGIKYQAYWRKIENRFYESLDEIIAARDIVFDITRTSWVKKIKRFRGMCRGDLCSTEV
ncbi:uncharacterized protein LOC143373392 isoform X2 [Andrena cerasifolii]|uniref:uncharacterized protein LOC143373392 isoform X2 n=1 Tax=Andrena cerasifolii TaxID=2819439 RepID=UPI00403831E4